MSRRNLIPTFFVVAQVVLAVIIAYFVASPIIPRVTPEIKRKLHPEAFTENYYVNRYSMETEAKKEDDKMRRRAEGLSEDKVIIPKIGVDISLITDDTEQDRALNKGAWMMPGSAYPGEHGQTVITGHRFQILPPAKNTFFNLDKLEVGDTFLVVYDGYAYKYEINNIEVREPGDFKFLGKTAPEDDMILYTCTPLWTAAKRLMLHAKRVPFD